MNKINGNTVGRVNVNERRNKIKRHMANTVITAGGVATAGLALKKGIEIANAVCLNEALGSAEQFRTTMKKSAKVSDFFHKMGNKLFAENTKLGKAMKDYSTNMRKFSMFEVEKKIPESILKRNKSIGAMVVAAGVFALGFIAAGIYKAGKING